jgi:AraC-like DNA-binding protein
MKTPTILGAHFGALVAYALAKGMTLQEVQAASGLVPGEVISPDARVPETRMSGLWTELFRRFPGQALPIDHVRAAPLEAVAGMAYSARYASDVRQIFELLLRNQKYSSEGTHLELVEEGEDAHFIVSHMFDQHVVVPKEIVLGVCLRVLTEVLELDIKAKSVSIGRRLDCDVAIYQAFFGVPVLQNAQDYRLTIDRAVLDQPSKDRNEDLSHYAEHFFNLALKKAGASGNRDYQALLGAIAENAAAGEFGVTPIARHTAMSVRAAQRVAARQGKTLAGLIREARFSRAKQLLTDSRVTLAEVAYFTGYSDDRAFRRAFKAHLGVTPSQYRDGER